MAGGAADRAGKSLRIARLLMVMGSLAPLFILWAIRGTRDVPDRWWIPGCLLLAAIPNAILFVRWHVARASNDHQVVIAKSAKDQSEHLLVYLFAMLIPLFGVDLGGTRDIAAAFAAFLFVVLIFWHMNLHYMNVAFAIFGYRVFTVDASRGQQRQTRSVVILSKRNSIPADTQIEGIRLSDTVFVEKE